MKSGKEPPKIDLANHRKLFTITDQLVELRRNPESLSRNDYKKLLQHICESFRESLECGLEAAFYSLRDASDPKNLQEAKEIFCDVERFSRYIGFQREALVGCKLKPATVDNVIRQIEILREIIADKEPHPGELTAAVNRSTDQVCDAADEAKKGLSQQQAFHLFQKRGLIATGSVVVLGSIVFIGTAGAAAPPMFIASGMFGGWMITMGSLKKDPLDKPPK